MKPSDLTPYVWNALLTTFRADELDKHSSPLTEDLREEMIAEAQFRAETWLSNHTAEDVFSRLLEYEGIIGYSTWILRLITDLNLPRK